jgi:membrane associated rhomboid family serine protease
MFRKINKTKLVDVQESHFQNPRTVRLHSLLRPIPMVEACLNRFFDHMSQQFERRRYWSDLMRKNDRHACGRRLPIATLAAAIAVLVVFYAADAGGLSYTPGPDGPWFGALASIFSHVNAEHLWKNLVMLVILGFLLEFTEGHLHLLGALWGGGLLGAALHGACKPGTPVRGASGSIYAIMWSQLSLLALNWGDLPARWLRLMACLMLLGVDVGVWWFARSPTGVSYESHLFGALAGICFSLVFGQNVRLHRWEVTLVWLGFSGYLALEAVAFANLQLAAGALGALLLPALLWRAVSITRRAYFTRGGTPSRRAQQPKVVLASTDKAKNKKATADQRQHVEQRTQELVSV